MRRPSIGAVVLTFLVACATTDEPYMLGRSAADRETAIKRELQGAAQAVLLERKAALDDDVSDELRLLWQMAARQLVEDDASRAEVGRAVMNARRIMGMAIAHSSPNGPQQQVTLENVKSARRSFCPCYPFC